MSSSIRVVCWLAAGLLAVIGASLGAAGQPVGHDRSLTTWEATPQMPEWVYQPQQADGEAIDLSLTLADTGRPVQITIHAGSEPNASGIVKAEVQRDKDSHVLTVQAYTHGDTWQKGERSTLNYWPPARDKRANPRLAEDGIEPQTWRNRELPVRIELTRNAARIWFQGRLIAQADRPSDTKPTVRIRASEGDAIVHVHTQASRSNWRYQTIDLQPLANETLADPIDSTTMTPGNVPFELVDGGRKWLNLKNVKWVDAVRNPSSYYEQYDSGPYFLGDDRMPMIQLPRSDYVAAHILAVADPSTERSNHLTLRTGRYNSSYRGQVVRYDFATEIPRSSPSASSTVGSPTGPLYAIRVPMSTAFAQDIIGDIIDVELTKEVRLARRTPDPNRYRWRPLGLPSGVRIAAITFERSPLQMTIGSDESGHLFVEPQTPTFNVTLENISDHTQRYRLNIIATHYYGDTTTTERAGQALPGKTIQIPVAIKVDKRGYYDLSVSLYTHDNSLLLERQTSFAVLPNVQRPYHEQCRIGVWDFTGGHLTPDDPDFVGPMYQKLGIRYGMFHHKLEDRQKYGVIKGNEASVRSNTKLDDVLNVYKKRLEEHPDQLKSFLLFHEDSISGPHVTRVPDLFHDRPPYKLDEDEQKRFDQMYLIAKTAAEKMREYDPSVCISLGNGPQPLREEFYRAGFPSELFDAAGNEAGVFGRLPERQPPDIVANNASIWMDRQLLDHYGYGDKPITQCYEITYPSTNPGNLSYGTQAAYFIRHILHSMAWDIPVIRVGSLTDMGNSYYFSNWGSCGFFRKLPEVNPKPAAVALATLTWVLDGATFDRKIDMGSDSLYGLAFTRRDNKRVVALWTIRGKRPITFTFSNTKAITLIDHQAIETTITANSNDATITVTPSPCYLVIDGGIATVAPGEPEYDAAPAGDTTVLDTFASLDNWTISDKRNPELEFYNPMEPRRKGDFRFEPVADYEGKTNVVRVTPQPIDHGKATMPMYAELIHNRGIKLPGKPTELGMWINGNSGWGRLIFEFTDANGERWISLGAPAAKGNRWMADWLPAEMLDKYNPEANADWNTNDVFGVSRFNFDGWRYVGVPMPGQYPGNEYHWPANSQWRHDQDGMVDYPITLTRVVIQLPEKTLHVKTFAPARRPEIYLKDLVVSEGGLTQIKNVVAEYNPDVQMGGL